LKRRRIFLACGCLLLAAALAVGILLWRNLSDAGPEPYTMPTLPAATAAPTDTASTDPLSTEPEPTEPEVRLDPEKLKEIGPDVYAWLKIEGSDIDFPIVQSPTDDTYYLRRDPQGNKDNNGCIFTEHRYNSTDFLSDPVTLIYGHNMRSGAMFGTLLKLYTDSAFLEEHPYITVYTTQGTLRYGVFAAVPYNSHHILYSYDFSDPGRYQTFLNRIHAVRDINARFVPEYEPEPGVDKMIVLSTCYGKDGRFLVLATLLP